MKKESLELPGTILIFLTAIVSGVSVVLNKFFIVTIDPLVFTAIRAFFIGLAFLVISLYFSKSSGKFKKVSWKYLLLIGIIGGGAAFWLFFTGLKLTTAGRAAFLHKTLPIYATILAFIFLKERINRKHLIAIFIMIVGLILIESISLGIEIQIGDILVLCATVLWAVENTISKKVMIEKESNWVVTFSRMFFGSLLLFSVIVISGKIPILLSLSLKQIAYISLSAFLLFLYVLFWYWGLRYINLSKASMILLISPVISLLLGTLWLNEKIFLLQIIGSIFILAGVYFIARIKSERKQK